MSAWFKLTRCPNCSTQREIKLMQKKCKCPNCKKVFNVK